jgi:hypothetical protein
VKLPSCGSKPRSVPIAAHLGHLRQSTRILCSDRRANLDRDFSDSGRRFGADLEKARAWILTRELAASVFVVIELGGPMSAASNPDRKAIASLETRALSQRIEVRR